MVQGVDAEPIEEEGVAKLPAEQAEGEDRFMKCTCSGIILKKFVTYFLHHKTCPLREVQDANRNKKRDTGKGVRR